MIANTCCTLTVYVGSVLIFNSEGSSRTEIKEYSFQSVTCQINGNFCQQNCESNSQILDTPLNSESTVRKNDNITTWLQSVN